MSEERYEIRGKIGQGGVGAVYRAYDTQLRREVAIKRVLADEAEGEEAIDSDVATKNLLKEATALSSVQHPHICTVYDAGIDKEGPYVVMELINGKTLDEMVERGTLTYDDFREVAIQSQEAMIAAQDLDLVHRDLKPSNVMVCWLPSGRFQVKLVDFGLAKFSAKPSLQTIDHGDAVFGSIFFMAPEQFERTPLDRRTDMYSLGCMYYYSLAGTYPFNGDSAPQVMASHLQNSVQPLQEVRPDLPQWVCEWVMWHLARDMDNRPESARVALEKYLLDETAAAQNGGALPLRTGPQLIMPATSPQPNRPAVQSTTVNTKTAPQSIAPPSGSRVLTSAQAVRPATSITGGTAIQPARPQVTPNSGATTQPVKAETGPQPTSPTLGVDIAAMQEAAKAKKKKVTLIALGGGIAVAGLLAASLLGDNKDTKIYNRLMEEAQDLKAKEFSTDEKELQVLFNALNDPEVTSRDFIYRYIYLSKAETDFDLDNKVWEFSKTADVNATVKGKLAEVLTRRGNEKTIAAMLDYIEANPDDSIASAVINTAAEKPNENHFSQFITILGKTNTGSTRKAAEAALKEVITDNSKAEKEKLAEQLLSAFNSSVDKQYKLSMIRLLGATGADSAEEKLSEALGSRDTQERIAAATAFGAWPSDSPFEELLEAFDDERSSQAKQSMFKGLLALLTADRAHNNAKLGDRWIQLAANAATESQKGKIISAATNANAKWSSTVLELFDDPSHGESIQTFAKRGLKKINK